MEDNVIMENIVLILSMQFLILISLVFLNSRALAKSFRSIKKMTWVVLVLIILLAPFLFLFNSPFVHFENLTIAKEFYMGGDYFVENSRYGPFYPYLIFLSFLVFGINSVAINYFELLFLALSILGVFLLSYFITRKELFSLIASGMYLLVSFYNFFIIHMNMYHFMLVFSLLFMLFSYKEDNWKGYSLALVTIYFAGMMRWEMMGLFYVFAAGLLIFKWNYAKSLKSLKPLLVRLSIPLVIFLVFSTVYFIKLDYTIDRPSEYNFWLENEPSPASEVISRGIIWPSIGYFSLDFVVSSLTGLLYSLMSPLIILFLVLTAIGLYLMTRDYKRIGIFLIAAFFIILPPYISCCTGLFQQRYLFYIIIPLLMFSAYAVYEMAGPLRVSRIGVGIPRRTFFAGLLVLLAGFSLIYSLPLSLKGSVFNALDQDPIYQEFHSISDTINTLSGEGENESVFLITSNAISFEEVRFLTLKRTSPLLNIIRSTDIYNRKLEDVEYRLAIESGFPLIYNESAMNEAEAMSRMILTETVNDMQDEYDKGNDPLLIRSVKYDTIYFLQSPYCDPDSGNITCELITKNINMDLLKEASGYKLYVLNP